MQKWTAQEVKKSYKLMAASYIIVLQLHEWRAKFDEDNWQQFYMLYMFLTTIPI